MRGSSSIGPADHEALEAAPTRGSGRTCRVTAPVVVEEDLDLAVAFEPA
jgi:hypothetical protein